jgi:hypothetical protein
MPRAVSFPLFLFLSVFFLFACAETDDDPVLPVGRWQDAWTTMVITSSNVFFPDYGYGGVIVDTDIPGGWLVFRYDAVADFNAYQSNRFNKLAWKNHRPGPPATLEYSEGYEKTTTNSDGKFIAWETAAEARQAVGIFGMYSLATNTVW